MSESVRRVLVTAFEPSGDVLAARLVEGLRARWPGVEVFALGGPALEAGGATLLEETTGHAAMGLGVASEVKKLQRRKKLVRAWLREHAIDVLVPVDSPAANWSFCKMVRRDQPGAKVVHLVAPQVWAWASWRVKWLARLSDRVLCLLPFEPAWLGARGVEAEFVGHPLYEREKLERAYDLPALRGEGVEGVGGLKVAFLPGSRTGEVVKNWADMLGAFELLRHRYPKMRVVVAASDPRRAELIKRSSPGGRLPRRVEMVVGEASAVLDWADCGVVVSGTATLEAASRGCPHVAMYRANRLAWNTVGRALLKTKYFALPNIVAAHLALEGMAEGGVVVPELVPHFGGAGPVAEALEGLLASEEARAEQRAAFAAIGGAFSAVDFGEAAVSGLAAVVEG